MVTRNIIAASVAFLFASSAAVIAAAEPSTCRTSFETQLTEAKAALLRDPPAGLGRVDQLRAEPNLAAAEALNRRGKTTEAQTYLNYARSTLDIPRHSPASTRDSAVGCTG